jgi:hypothetical protein
LELSRRGFVIGAVAAPVAAAMIPRGAWAAGQPMRWFNAHQELVVVAATARMIPGPKDDLRELGHPGAREAGVVNYIDALLSAFEVDPPRIYAGGPFSGRHGGGTDDFSHYVPLSPIQDRYWRAEVARLQKVYEAGITALDAAAGGDFAHQNPVTQDLILTGDQSGFRDVLFDHAIEGWLANPEYGGNDDLSGWVEVAFAGDVCPEGFTPDQVSQGDGLDIVDPTGVVTALIGHLRVMLDG